jgi:hypothetical protein
MTGHKMGHHLTRSDTKWDTILHKWDTKWDTNGHQMGQHFGQMGHERTPMDTKLAPRAVMVKYWASRGVST